VSTNADTGEKLLQVSISDSGEHTKHMSLSPRNMEYIKYNWPSVQLSCHAFATKRIFLYSLHLVVCKIYIACGHIFSILDHVYL
jgi:hypothetical protein